MVEEQGSQGTTHPVEVQVQELLGVVTTTTTKTKAGRNQTQMRKKKKTPKKKKNDDNKEDSESGNESDISVHDTPVRTTQVIFKFYAVLTFISANSQVKTLRRRRLVQDRPSL